MITLSDFANRFEEAVNGAALQNSVKIAKGSIKNMKEYNRGVGRNEGLYASLNLMKDMLKKMQSDDDGSDLPEMEDVS